MDPIDPTEAVQVAVGAALDGFADLTALVGAAVYAERQPFPDLWPRVTFGTPQVVPGASPASSDVFVTVHSWANGVDATLVAGRVAGAVRRALDVALAVPGHHVSSSAFQGASPVGDPDPLVEHVVSTFRYSIQPAG